MVAAVEVCLDSRQRVSALVTAMAGLVETAVDQAVRAQLEGDSLLARAVLQREMTINHLEMHIDAGIPAHLGPQHLGGRDIRAVGWKVKNNKDLERMGDLAANIARKVVEL